MPEIAISVIVFGIVLVAALALLAIIYLRLIPSASDYLNNLIKNAVNTLMCMINPFC